MQGMDGQYVGETKTINGKTYHTLYLYDDGGRIIGLQEDGETYYFVKNLQGDVVGILNEEGEAVGYYFYDIWGNIASVYSSSSWNRVTDPEHIALMYDEESGLYYLQSRYYADTVGKNTKVIKTYIAEQLKKDKESDEINMFDPRNPFMGSK